MELKIAINSENRTRKQGIVNVNLFNLAEMENNFKQLLHPVKAFAFDIDGVLTDGSLLITEEGHQLRAMNIRDGYALQLAVKKGYLIFIISGSISQGVLIRLNRLGITHVFMQAEDKAAKLKELLLEFKINSSELLYMGDDLPDLSALKLAGIATCPADAVPEIKNACIYISEKSGGTGCVRDVIEQVMRLQNKWE